MTTNEELLQKIAQATSRIQELLGVKANAEAMAKSYEAQARDQHKLYYDAKTEIQQLTKVLEDSRVQAGVNNAIASASLAEQKATEAQQQAEQHRDSVAETLQRLTEKEAQLDALLAKAAAPPPAAEPAAAASSA